jgi:predicted lipoprotein with Yx(FWY)xxD motif
MSRSRSISVLAAVVPLTAVAIAADVSAVTASRAASKATDGRTLLVAAANHRRPVATLRTRTSRLGKILVDSRGRTLYLFKKDSGSKSACFGACAAAWPPLRASGKPTVGSSLRASKVRTAKRSDGKPQVTYNGHPLYRFIGDKKAGDTNGQGLTAFGGRWFALSRTGHPVSSKPSTSSGGTGY